MWSKIKSLAKKYEKITKVLLTLLIFVSISLVSTLLLYAFGIIYFEDGIQINIELFDSFKTTWYGVIFIILFQIVITSLLSFVPGASMAFILLLQALYANPPVAFAVAFSGVMLSSFMLYILGRFGGYTLCKKIIGEEDTAKASELLNNKGTIYFPIMMMFPIFPDDALTMVAGTLKMSLKWFIPSIVIGRGIGVATIVFGVSIVPFDKFTTPWHWIIFILLCALGIALVFFAASRFNKFMEKKRNQSDATDDDEEDEEINDETARVIVNKDIYPDGANSPTIHIEYYCPCGKGKIIYERVVGFDDYYAIIKCKRCSKKYETRTACGHYWELIKK
ncbi:MAG: TVP38/TMEM64 family protein [Clostridia bacterium]|nr:TVP38/TMEM64 family protein [Clostridia bacterium]